MYFFPETSTLSLNISFSDAPSGSQIRCKLMTKKEKLEMVSISASTSNFDSDLSSKV